MKKYSSILLLSFSLLSGVAMAGGTTEAGIGGALVNRPWFRRHLQAS